MNEETKLKKFEAILKKAENDDRIIGVVLAGARGKGMFTEHSDYDIALYTVDGVVGNIQEEYKSEQGVMDIGVLALSDFKNYAGMGSAEEWDRYTYAHITATIDKTGEVQKIIDEKGVLPPDHVSRVVKKALDAYLNLLYRSVKNDRDGNLFSSHFDACESLSSLLTFLFAVEGKIRPYNKFLKWELENYPLRNLSIVPSDFLRKIELIINTGDIEIQKELHLLVEEIAIKNNCGDVIDSWEGYYFGEE